MKFICRRQFVLSIACTLIGCGRSGPAPKVAETGLIDAKNDRINSRLRSDLDSKDEELDLETPKAPDHTLTADELDVSEALFRDLLPPSMNVKEVCFLSIGVNEKTKRWVDAPAGLIARLENLGLDLRPASQGSIPVDDERLDMRDLIVTDPRTGKHAYVYAVAVTKWMDATTARAVVVAYKAPLVAHGYSAIVRKRADKWRIDQRLGNWLSRIERSTRRQAS